MTQPRFPRSRNRSGTAAPCLRRALSASVALTALAAWAPGAQAQDRYSIPLDYTYAKATDGSFSVSRITVLAAINDGKVQRYVFDTGSDQFNTQIDPGTTGLTENGDPFVYAYGAGDYGYVAQRFSFDTLAYHDPRDETATVVVAPLDGSDHRASAIRDIVYTRDSPQAEGLNLSPGVVTAGLKDMTGRPVTAPLRADLDAREAIARGAAADEGGTVWGTFGAGDFLLKGGSGQNLIGATTTSGYVVAANGNSGQTTNRTTPGCSPCAIVGLDASLRAQFTSFAAWGEAGSDATVYPSFPGSGANASTEFEGDYALGLFAGKGKDPVAQGGVAVLLDTGTPGSGDLTLSEARMAELQAAGAVFAKDGDAYTLSELTLTAPDGQPVTLNDVRVTLTTGAADDPVTFIAGQDFFLQQSVMYDLARRSTAYSDYFVSAGNFTTDAPAAGEIRLSRITRPMGAAWTVQDDGGKTRKVGFFGAAGVISGAGGLTVAGNALARLTGVNTYTGATVIAAGGGLQLAGPGSIEASRRVEVKGQLDIGAKGNAMAEWGVSDAANDARIRSLAGTGEVDLGARRLILIAAADRFSGSISDLGDDKTHGGGGVSVLGGAQVFSGRGDYTGTTVIGTGAGLMLTETGQLASPVAVAGLLRNDGTISGATQVAGGGTATGSGRFGDLEIASGGTLAPGAGTLRVAGGLTMRGGAGYLVGAGAGVAVDGRATVATDARVVLTRASAEGFDLGARRVLLTADGGIAGGFGVLTGDLASDAPFVEFALGADAGSLYLDSARSGLAYADVAWTANQRAAAAAVEAGGEGDDLHDAILFMGRDDARRSFDSLSGEIHASVQGVLVEESRFLRNAATDRLRGALAGAGGQAADGPQTWAQAFGSWGSLDGDGNAGKLDRSTGGVFVGADTTAEDWRLGALIGIGDTSLDLDSRRSSASSRTYQIGLYAGMERGAFAFRGGVGHARHRIETDRQADPALSPDPQSAAYHGHSLQAFGELGYRIDRGSVALEPYAALAHVRLRTDGGDEAGGPAALGVEDGRMDTTFATLGLRAATDLRLGAAPVAVSGGIGWRHAFGDTVPERGLVLGGAGFAVSGAPIARNAAVVDLGLDMAVGAGSSLRIEYQGQLAKDDRDHNIGATFKMQF